MTASLSACNPAQLLQAACSLPWVAQVPYVSQRFAQGNHCDRDPHPETGRPRPPITRHTDLRLMCSPDKDVSRLACSNLLLLRFALQHRCTGLQWNDLDADHCPTGFLPPVLISPALPRPVAPPIQMHIIVSEPEQCIYVIELYLPALCGHPGFAPEAPPGGWTPDDGTGGLQVTAVSVGMRG